jgi:hypothetical protein
MCRSIKPLRLPDHPTDFDMYTLDGKQIPTTRQ